MALSTNLSNSATRLISKYGESVTFSRTTGGTFDPATGTTTGATTTETTVSAAPMQYNQQDIDGEVIQSGDVALLIDSTYKPAVDDSVTYNGDTWQVVDFTTWRVQGVDVGYKVQVRK